jgi:NAD(P)H dehydrogenase (quinone)
VEGWGALIPLAAAAGVLPSFHHPVDKEFPTVSARDVGVIAAHLAREVGTEPPELIVHAEGPRRYSANDVAKALSELLGRTVTVQAVLRAQWQPTLTKVVSESTATLLTGLYDAHNRGGLIDVEPNGEVRRGATALIDALRPLVR